LAFLNVSNDDLKCLRCLKSIDYCKPAINHLVSHCTRGESLVIHM